MVIQHNIPALNSHRNMGLNNAHTAKNLEKLSSGYRVNRAGDDAAGLAISEKMRGQIKGIGMAEQNANNGINLIQIAEGGLNETHDILQRMRELAVQSSNGTYQDDDREQIELEFQALKSEIDRISTSTHYNGIKVLDGTTGGVKLSHATGAAGFTGVVEEPTPVVLTDVVAVSTDVNVSSVNVSYSAGLGTVGAGPVTVGGETLGEGYLLDGGGGATATVASGLGFDLTVVTAAGTSVTGSTGSNLSGTINGTSLTAATVTISYNSDLNSWSVAVDGFVTGAVGADGLATLYANGSSEEAANALTVNVKTLLDAFDSTLLSSGLDNKDIVLEAKGDLTTGVGLTGADFKVTSEHTITSKYDFSLAANGMSGTVDLDVTYADGAWSFTASGNTVTDNVLSAAGAQLGSVTYDADASKIYINIADKDGKDIAGEFLVLDFDKAFKNLLTDADGVKADNMQFKLTDIDLDVTGSGTAANNYVHTDLTAQADIGMKASFNPVVEAEEVDTTVAANMKDTVRADAMLKSFGMDKTSAFALQGKYAATYADKDAQLIVRDNQGKQEMMLAIGDKIYAGTSDGSGGITFKDSNGDTVATLSSAVMNGANSKDDDGKIITGAVSFNIGKASASAVVNKENAMIGTSKDAQLVFQIGANGAEDQRVGMYVYNMGSANLGNADKGKFVSESTIVTRDQANEAVNTLDSAINQVSSQRANLGALQNRLEHTLNNLGVTKENLTAAESSIRDVDMAKEMMDFTKNNILVQASQAMLAQANSLPQGVLSLLR